MDRVFVKSVSVASMFVFLAGAALAQSAPVPAFDAHVLAGKIEDKRSSEPSAFMNSLEISLKVMGDSVRDAEGITSVAVTKAVDDQGRDLRRKDDASTQAVLFSFKEIGKGQSSVETNLKLDNPSRRAAMVQEVSGTIQFYIPGKDPKSKITLPIAGKTGTWLALGDDKISKLRIMAMTKDQYDAARKDEEKKKEAEATADKSVAGSMTKAFGDVFKTMFSGFGSMGPNDMAFAIEGEDAVNQVVKIEIFDAAGNPVKSNSKSGSRLDSATEKYTFSFQTPVPPDAKLVVSVTTPSSIVNVPFTLTNVPLP